MHRNHRIICLVTRAARLACATLLLLVCLVAQQTPRGDADPTRPSTRGSLSVYGNSSARSVSNRSSSNASVLPTFESFYNDYLTARSRAAGLTISVQSPPPAA